MSEPKFTKGEWLVSDATLDGKHIKDTWGVSVDCALLCRVFTGPTFGTVESVQLANAHLIAAAPDMYKALERQRVGLINLIDLNIIVESQFESVRHEISLIDNELSKARGE